MLALAFFGLGLLGLTPVLSFFATLRIRTMWNRRAASEGRVPLSSRLGIAGGIVAVILPIVLNAPAYLTRYGLNQAVSSNEETAARGVRFLREYGDDELLLDNCYGQPGEFTDPVLMAASFLTGELKTPSEAVRPIYYRVTGRPFNTVEPPEIYRSIWGGGRFSRWNDRGGTEVSAVADNLSLIGSRLDGTVDADAAHAYFEWTLTFRNEQEFADEARAQLQLPPGAVVSRLTLWVNGEEREAAFASRADTREAYEGVVRRQQDPVLVTTSGADHALIQCFPVPSYGEMKTRVGITVPLVLDDNDSAVVVLPRIAERNFAVACDHNVWIDTHAKTLAAPPDLEAGEQGEEGPYLRGALPDAVLADLSTSIRVARTGESSSWTPALASDESRAGFVRQDIRMVPVEAPESLVVVIDGSWNVRAYAEELSQALRELSALTLQSEGLNLEVLVAGDEVVCLLEFDEKGTDSTAIEKLAKQVAEFDYIGGRDGVAALTEAVERVVDVPKGAVLWIHGPQPLLSEPVELEQLLERSDSAAAVQLPDQSRPQRTRASTALRDR